jgi:iron complex outermembrane recepter protein
MLRSTLFASVATAACLSMPGLAMAQQTANQAAEKSSSGVAVQELVVTGSRIPQPNFEQPTPVAVLSSTCGTWARTAP